MKWMLFITINIDTANLIDDWLTVGIHVAFELCLCHSCWPLRNDTLVAVLGRHWLVHWINRTCNIWLALRQSHRLHQRWILLVLLSVALCFKRALTIALKRLLFHWATIWIDLDRFLEWDGCTPIQEDPLLAVTLLIQVSFFVVEGAHSKINSNVFIRWPASTRHHSCNARSRSLLLWAEYAATRLTHVVLRVHHCHGSAEPTSLLIFRRLSKELLLFLNRVFRYKGHIIEKNRWASFSLPMLLIEVRRDLDDFLAATVLLLESQSFRADCRGRGLLLLWSPSWAWNEFSSLALSFNAKERVFWVTHL